MNQRRDGHWRKSTQSATVPNCVELRLTPDDVWVRDSKLRSMTLSFPASRLTMLLDAVKADHRGFRLPS
jgi:Domain of unknown function (DUF397)